MSRLFKYVYLAAGVALFAAIVARLDMAEVWAQVLAVGWGFAVVVAVFFVSFSVDALSWMLTLARVPVTWRWLARFWNVRMAGEAFNYVLPAAGFGGEPLKAVLLKRHYRIGYREASASLVLARTLNMIALIAFLAIGMAMMLTVRDLPAATGPTALAGLAVLGLGTVVMVVLPRWGLTSTAGRWLGRRAMGERLARAVAVVADLEARIAGYYGTHRWRFTSALTLGFGAWILGVVEVHVTLAFIGHPISWTEAWVIEAVAQMVRTATFFIPASLGAQEGAFVLVAGAVTGSPATGLSVALVRRLREALWVAAGLGIASAYSVAHPSR